MLRVLIEKEGFRVGADHNNLRLADIRNSPILATMPDEVIAYSGKVLKSRIREDHPFDDTKDVLLCWPSNKVTGQGDESEMEIVALILSL